MGSEKTKEVGIRLSVRDAAVVRAALTGVGADGEKAIKLIDNAARKASPGLLALSNGIQRSKEYARDFAVEGVKSFLGPVAAIATATGAIELLKDSIEQVNKVAEAGDLAERIGIDLPKLQGLQATFKESGNDVDELNGALETFGTNLQKAKSQGGTLADIFKINGKAITGDTLTDLKTYADLVKNAGNQQERLYLVTQAFGKGNKTLTDLLVQGGAGIGHAADEAERLGTALSDMDVTQAREAVKQLAETNLKLDAAKEKFGVLITPEVIASLDAFNAALTTMRDRFEDIHNQDLGGLISELQALQQAGHSTGGLLNLPHGNVFAMGADMQPGALDANAARQKEIMDELRRRAIGGLSDKMADGGDAADVAGIYRGLIAGPTPPKPKDTKLPVAPDHAAEQAAKAIKDVTDALNLQIKNLTETNRQQEINNALSRAKVDASSKEGKAIADLAGTYYDQKQAIEAVSSATSFLAQTGENAFEGLIDGSKSWTDVLGDMASALEKAVLQASLLGSGPLADILGTQSQTSGGTGGIFGSIINAITGAISNKGGNGDLGVLTPNIKNASGNAFAGSPDLHSYAGSVVRQPTAFRFAKGMGIMGEQPGSPGEAILPLQRDSKGRLGVSGAGGSGGVALSVSLQITRMPGSGQDSAAATQRGNMLQIKAMIYDTVAEGVATPGNPVNKALRTTFGARPQITGR